MKTAKAPGVAIKMNATVIRQISVVNIMVNKDSQVCCRFMT